MQNSKAPPSFSQANEKFMRTIRVRNEQHPGTLGRLLLAIGNAGGDIGEVRLIPATLQPMASYRLHR
jgi:hypothetical protein